MKSLTTAGLERNIYLHPVWFCRDIFWRRIERLILLARGLGQNETKAVLDFGGGSGVLARPLSKFFQSVDVVDLDAGDARRIVKEFNLPNVQIFQEDVVTFEPQKKYDVIIAADVLEHFADLQVPFAAINRLLKMNGKLLVSLPTENFLYRIGRLLIGKKKPADHFHTAEQVVQFLETQEFRLTEKNFEPHYGLSVPLFLVACFERSRA